MSKQFLPKVQTNSIDDPFMVEEMKWVQVEPDTTYGRWGSEALEVRIRFTKLPKEETVYSADYLVYPTTNLNGSILVGTGDIGSRVISRGGTVWRMPPGQYFDEGKFDAPPTELVKLLIHTGEHARARILVVLFGEAPKGEAKSSRAYLFELPPHP